LGLGEAEDPTDEERIMARVIVTPDETDVVLLEESVYPVHLENKLSSLQVIERLAWAVDDAEAGQPRDREQRTRVGAES
jgi:hypothetical protein